MKQDEKSLTEEQLVEKIAYHGKLRDDAISTGDRRTHADQLVDLKRKLRELRLDNEVRNNDTP